MQRTNQKHGGKIGRQTASAYRKITHKQVDAYNLWTRAGNP